MTLPTNEQARSWRGLTLVTIDEEPVGEIEAIYVDRASRQPEWALIQTGLFGGARTFVPLADATQLGDTVQVPHETSVVREAPRLELDAKLSEEDEARLYAHYGIPYTTEESPSRLPTGENASNGAGTAAATDATTELPPSSRLEADPPDTAGLSAAAGSTRATRRGGPGRPAGSDEWPHGRPQGPPGGGGRGRRDRDDAGVQAQGAKAGTGPQAGHGRGRRGGPVGG